MPPVRQVPPSQKAGVKVTPIWHNVLTGCIVVGAIAFAVLLYAFCRAGAEALELEQEDEK